MHIRLARSLSPLSSEVKKQKQKLVKPKPLASKMAAVGQKNGEVGLLVEYLFCVSVNQTARLLSFERFSRNIRDKEKILVVKRSV